MNEKNLKQTKTISNLEEGINWRITEITKVLRYSVFLDIFNQQLIDFQKLTLRFLQTKPNQKFEFILDLIQTSKSNPYPII